MKLYLVVLQDTVSMFSTGSYKNSTAINIIGALTGITFRYQLKLMIGILLLESCFLIVANVLSLYIIHLNVHSCSMSNCSIKLN